MQIETRLRASHVKRWGIVRVARQQNIAEHMYRVWLLVREFGPIVGLDDEQQRAAEFFALVHDLPEVETGDIATPVKSKLPPLESIEAAYCQEHAAASLACSPETLRLVKLCDLIEAAVFLSIEGMGRHAYEVETSIKKRIADELITNGWEIMAPRLYELMEC